MFYADVCAFICETPLAIGDGDSDGDDLTPNATIAAGNRKNATAMSRLRQFTCIQSTCIHTYICVCIL